MTNRRKGFAAEANYMYNNWLFRYSGSRFYASMGLFDCIFIDKNYVTHLVQVKKATKKTTTPRISKHEIWEIQTYVDQMMLKDKPHLWVGYVLIPWRQKPVEVRLN